MHAFCVGHFFYSIAKVSPGNTVNVVNLLMSRVTPHALLLTRYPSLILQAVDMREYLTDNETLAMLIACFCHDLDHRGTTNAFQVASRYDLIRQKPKYYKILIT